MTKKNIIIVVKLILFLFIMLGIGFLAGYLLGVGSNRFDYDELYRLISQNLIVPGYVIFLLSTLLAVVATAISIRCRLSIRSIDENSYESVEKKLEIAATFSELSVILNLLGFSFLWSSSSAEQPLFIGYFGLLIYYLLNMVIISGTQKRLNPEKTANVLDIRYHKEYLKTCDEAERAQIGRASYISYRATSNTILIMWVITSLLSMVIELGIYPVVVITVIWIVHYLSFVIAANKKEER